MSPVGIQSSLNVPPSAIEVVKLLASTFGVLTLPINNIVIGLNVVKDMFSSSELNRGVDSSNNAQVVSSKLSNTRTSNDSNGIESNKR